MNNIIALSQDNFDAYFDKHDFIVMDFSADWCEPCQSFSSIVADVAGQFPDTLFASIDVGKEQDLARAFNVRSVPTTIIFRYQVAVFIQSGILAKQELRRLLGEAQALSVTDVHA